MFGMQIGMCGVGKPEGDEHRSRTVLRLATGMALAIVMAIAFAGTAQAQSGLEQSKSAVEALTPDIFGEVDPAVLEQVRNNGIAVPSGEDEWAKLVQQAADGEPLPTPDVPIAYAWGRPGQNGWYRSDVLVLWQNSRGLLFPFTPGVTVQGCGLGVVVANTSAQVSCRVTDAAGTWANSIFIKTDNTAPQVTLAGVEDGAVYVAGRVPEPRCDTSEVADIAAGRSGVQTQATVTISGGPLGEITASCAGAKDNAGNPQTAVVEATYRVLAPPQVTPQITGLEREGWYYTDVSLTWQVSGDEIQTTGCDSVTVSTDQVATFTCTASNEYGDSHSASVTIKRDTTAPDVAVTGVQDGAVYTVGSVPVIGCQTEQEGVGESGTVQQAALTTSGGPLGSVIATCAGARDIAGNTGSASVTFQVHYPFAGFYAPIDSDTLNVVAAGRAVPVKFSLSGDRGLDIVAAGSPTSQEIACDGSLPQVGVEETVDDARDSGLTYDSTTDTYLYVWKTSDNWGGTCRMLTVALIDGSKHTAMFRLR